MSQKSATPLKGLRALVVDDESKIRSVLAMSLEVAGCEVEQAANRESALAKVTAAFTDLVFLDLRLEAENGLDVLRDLLSVSPNLVVIMMTAYGTIDTTVEAMHRGAADYVPKPFTPAQILHVAERALERAQLRRQVAHLEDQISRVMPEIELSTRSPVMSEVLAQIEKAAVYDVAVLLLGESGTGKGVMAQRLHELSPRRAKPFVTVNCPTLSSELLASELFGHARGAFTGAVRDQEGRVESAAGGTLFLDEIAEIPLPLQAKLLRFLQDHRFERVGETRTRTADVRIITATNRRLRDEVAAGGFREDLYHRLNTLEVTLPPLRDRAEDIEPLALRFLTFFAGVTRRKRPELSEKARSALVAYRWPGNVRELRNAIERVSIFCAGDTIDAELLPKQGATADAEVQVGGPFALEDVERAHIEQVVASAPNLEEAAATLKIDISTLRRKRKLYRPDP